MTPNQSRLRTLEAVALLPVARFMVDVVPLKYWRASLGTIVAKSLLPETARIDQAVGRHPAFLARKVERAARILPFSTKCLPRAVTLQWMLKRRGIAAHLVIAMQKGTKHSPHLYHAWVEMGGEMLIGHCDRSLYSPLMVLSNMAAPAALPSER